MPRLLKIGIVGCGAIGSSLAKAVVSDFSDKAKLTGLFDIQAEKAYELAQRLNNKRLAIFKLDNLIKDADLVIEATKAGSAFEIAQKTILASKSIMIMSVGGIIKYYNRLNALAKKKNVFIYLPSGAICGIDGLKALSLSKIKKVTLTTKKPPQAFQGVPYLLKEKINIHNIKKEKVIFAGSAAKAIDCFPQNINVAATLSMAGIGPKKTLVRIVASPYITRNIHEIEIESQAGSIFTRTENVIHPDNPKTSYLAVLSAIATLKQVLDFSRIGT